MTADKRLESDIKSQRLQDKTVFVRRKEIVGDVQIQQSVLFICGCGSRGVDEKPFFRRLFEYMVLDAKLIVVDDKLLHPVDLYSAKLLLQRTFVVIPEDQAMFLKKGLETLLDVDHLTILFL